MLEPPYLHIVKFMLIRAPNNISELVILGNDAWDPAGDAWTLEDYTREQQDQDNGPESTPSPIEGGE